MTHTTKLPLVFIALVCAVPLAAPAFAQDDVLIVSQSALQQWQKDRTRDLDRLLATDRHPIGYRSSGIVQIGFTLDANGRPTGFETMHNSAGFAALRTARRAVSRMKQLDAVPVADLATVRFQANVIFARSEREREALVADLAEIEDARLAAGPATATVIAIG